jgi:hypothetical protein
LTNSSLKPYLTLRQMHRQTAYIWSQWGVLSLSKDVSKCDIRWSHLVTRTSLSSAWQKSINNVENHTADKVLFFTPYYALNISTKRTFDGRNDEICHFCYKYVLKLKYHSCSKSIPFM